MWDSVARVVAIGDVHGRHDQLVSLLHGTRLADDQLNWIGGQAHLILTGDLIDRGPADRAVLDLVQRLERQAESAGGRVHALLGNHGVMNLTRDFRYVSEGGYAEFAKDEHASDREAAWEGYQKEASGSGGDRAQLEAAFNKSYPHGYFARQRAFSGAGEYGRWLLERPAIIKVNGIVFLHGGLTSEVASLGLDRINSRVRSALSDAMSAEDALADLLGGPGRFQDLVGVASRKSQTGNGLPFRVGGVQPLQLTAPAGALLKALNDLPFAPDGPLWYRGTSLMNERLERDQVMEVLKDLDARAMMIGHTITKTSQISTRFDGRVYRGDVGMGVGRPGQAVVFEDGQARAFNAAAGTYAQPVAEPPSGEGWARGYEDLPDYRVEDFLRTAQIVERQKIGRRGQTAELWELEAKGLKLRGIFKEKARGNRYQHEIGAYWLDRRLGLGFVPPVVERKADGRTGALRAVEETAIDVISIRSSLNLEGARLDALIRAVAEKHGVAQSALEDQVRRARIFDGLIGVLNRQDVDALFVPGEGRVALVNHERAFGTSPEIRAVTLETCRPLPLDVEQTLRSLEKGELAEGLGQYLSGAEIDALLLRRDRLLRDCATR